MIERGTSRSNLARKTRSYKVYSIASKGRDRATGSGTQYACTGAEVPSSSTPDERRPPILDLAPWWYPPVPAMLGRSAIPAAWRPELEATRARGPPHLNCAGPCKWRFGRSFISLEIRPSQAGTHLRLVRRNLTCKWQVTLPRLLHWPIYKRPSQNRRRLGWAEFLNL